MTPHKAVNWMVVDIGAKWVLVAGTCPVADIHGGILATIGKPANDDWFDARN